MTAMENGDNGEVASSNSSNGSNWLYPALQNSSGVDEDMMQPHLQHEMTLQAPPASQPPTAPTALSSSTSSSSDQLGLPPLCSGCNLRIVDQFYLSALDSKWHTTCLKCSECGVELESSCYERDGLILCKEDYHRIYGALRANARQCARCLVNISRSELVMKARFFLYHVDCFKCVVCDVPLIKGDLFGMFESVVYCQTHYRQHQEQQMSLQDEFSQGFFGYDDGSSGGGAFGTPSQGNWGASSGPDSDFGGENNNSINPTTSKKRGRRKRDLSEDEAARSCFPYLDPASGLVEKTKRARTSFKHHQLRIMKSHFQMNQNPDSRELKDLASKTGLDKKVLQVWFQNARAKWRRMNNSQGMSSGSACPTPGPSVVDTSPLTDVNPYVPGGH